jgi:predicted esterase
MKTNVKTTLKRMTSLLLTFALVLSLAACGSTADNAAGNNQEEAASSEASSAADSSKDTVVAEDPSNPANETESSGETSNSQATDTAPAGSYSLVQNVYNWGSNYSKVILPVSDEADVEADDYTVSVQRYDVNAELLDEGERMITDAYLSDATGEEADNGSYVTLVLHVAASESLGSPYYTNPDSFMGQLKSWADCNYTITNTVSGESWNQLNQVYHPDEEGFSTAVYTESEYELPYAYYEPEQDGETHPLVVWLHGAGSGGTDIQFVTGGMMVTNWITEETQDIFDGAHILLPQSETWWLDNGSDEDSHYTTDGTSIYTESLKALIDDYVANHSDVDPNRIYIGGCSNGGYMTLNMAINYPDYFAALFPVCEAYTDEWITDEQIESIKDIPTWFVHCQGDPLVDIEATAIPTYERLLAAGAENLHFSMYQEIIDPDYGNAYVHHFAWVYALKNLCATDYDGSTVMVDGHQTNLFQWLALQSK